jgi:mannonate dehydratase
MLTRENFLFARQAGASHFVVHLTDYFNQSREGGDNQPVGRAADGAWGHAGDPDRMWTYEELVSLRKQVNDAGLELEALENFDPAHWFDVLLDGPKKKQQLENLKKLIRDVGRAGIPIFGYYFSLAGVAGRISGPFARGEAVSVGMDGNIDTPIPSGMVWNMIYDRSAPAGVLPTTTNQEMWQRLSDFLNALVPVAEEAGVRLAAHPDDPPVPEIRGTPRLIYKPEFYDRLLQIRPSSANALEFCVGTIAEMPGVDVYETVDHFSRNGNIAYVHFRNVSGKAPHYRETFVDDGDVDMPRLLSILKRNHFDGVLIPDHTPQMSCAAPWHAGMAFALGYMKAAISLVS